MERLKYKTALIVGAGEGLLGGFDHWPVHRVAVGKCGRRPNHQRERQG